MKNADFLHYKRDIQKKKFFLAKFSKSYFEFPELWNQPWYFLKII